MSTKAFKYEMYCLSHLIQTHDVIIHTQTHTHAIQQTAVTALQSIRGYPPLQTPESGHGSCMEMMWEWPLIKADQIKPRRRQQNDKVYGLL